MNSDRRKINKYLSNQPRSELKVTNAPSLTTCASAPESYLEVKHTPPEISVGNINTGEKLWARMERTRAQIVHLYLTFGRASFQRHKSKTWRPTIAYCLRCVLRQPCALWLVLCAKGVEGGDGQAGRVEEGVEDERWCFLLITHILWRITSPLTRKPFFKTLTSPAPRTDCFLYHFSQSSVTEK